MSDESRQESDEESLSIHIERLHAGPLPSPEAFRHYENTLPGAADRILTITEFNIRHRASVQKLAMWIGFIIAVGCLIGALTLAFVATPAAAVLFPIVPTLVSGGAYAYGLKKRAQQQQLPSATYAEPRRELPESTNSERN